VARVLAGDHEALGQLVAPYVGSQDALLLALVKLDQFDRSRRFGPWPLARRRRRVRWPAGGAVDSEIAAQLTPAQRTRWQEMMRRMNDRLQRGPPPHDP